MFNVKRSYTGLSAFFLVLFCMPLGHAAMILMEHWFDGTMLYGVSVALGAVGMGIMFAGTRVNNENTSTLLGFFGALLVWTGWIEFVYVYFAVKLNVQPLLADGKVVTKPEYLLLMSSVGFWSILMLLYALKLKNGCPMYCWIQQKLHILSSGCCSVVSKNKSVTTFMETNMLLWTSYLLLMFAYDESFLGERHPLTLIIAIACLIWSGWLMKRLLKIRQLGYAIRYALPVVIIFWTFVEVIGRIGLLKEIWIEPMKYKGEMYVMLIAFILVILSSVIRRFRKDIKS